MNYLGGYRISSYPRYYGESSATAVAQNLFDQSALWAALHILIVSERNLSVELRLIGNIEDGSISVHLLFLETASPAERSGVAGPRLDFLETVGQLLPKDYVWFRLTDDELAASVEPSRLGKQWQIARIVRRTQYIDLPSYIPAGNSDSLDALGKTGRQSSLTLNLPDSDGLRHLPDDPGEFQSQLEVSRYCLPLLGQINTFVADRRQLFEEIQASAPIIVSIALHPFDATGLSDDRQVATKFRYFIDLCGAALANSGFSHLDGLRGIYDRYFLTRNYIGIATVRVAALNPARAVGVAHHVCSWLGGMKTFAILQPTKRFDEIRYTLANPSIEFPASKASPDWEKPLRRLDNELALEKIEAPVDTRYRPFLIRLPHVYSLEEATQLVRLPFAEEHGLPGLVTRIPTPFTSPSQRYDPIVESGSPNPKYRSAAEDRVRIGRVNPKVSANIVNTSSDRGLHWHSIPVDDLSKHALIVGSTGSGKTVTTLFLLRELLRIHKNFLVIEPVKTEYYDRLRTLPEIKDQPGAIARYRLEGSPDGKGRAKDFLPFDPMRLQKGVTVSRHVAYLKSCFEAAFPLDAVFSLVLENGITEYYKKLCNWGPFTRGGERPKKLNLENKAEKKIVGVFPSFQTFTNYFVDDYLEKEFPHITGAASSALLEDWRQMFRRRFKNLQEGPLGQAFKHADAQVTKESGGNDFSNFLDRPTIIELDAVPDPEQKALLMAFLTTFIFERRQADDLLEREAGQTPDSSLRHVLVIEEAHRILANTAAISNRGGLSAGQDSRSKAVSLFVDMLAEIRAFGQGIIIVEQIPNKIVPDAIKNTNLKIMLRLTAKDDRDSLGAAMNFNEKQKWFVNSLRAETGKLVQYVVFEENVDDPVLLSLPLPNRDDPSPTDRYFLRTDPSGKITWVATDDGKVWATQGN